MTPKDKLLKRLPPKYHCMVSDIVAEDGLIDDCRYMLYLNPGVSFGGIKNIGSLPVKSITEAALIIKEDCEYEVMA